MTIEQITGLGRVIPVVVVHDAGDAVPLAERLVERGMPAIDVTLRTPAALDAIERIAEVPGAVVGAGTVTTPRQVDEALAAGARFLVSPGATPRLLDALQGAGAPFLPGAATPSEMLALLERGITHAKFFPAEASGGVPAVKALAGPFPQLRLCPTGGIDANKAGRYLAQPNVACVGGSWMLEETRIAGGVA
jgi:2-dehydro-3-deoxyphosphogluconate aldolase/(4S)-4-hydroxy-2-oxoglutarate aldolase